MGSPEHHVYWITRPGREKNPPAEILRARRLGHHVHVITDHHKVRLRGKRGTVCVDADLQAEHDVQLALEATKIAGCNVVTIPVVGDPETDASGIDPKILALLTAGFDAAVVIKELADDCPDTQGRDWAMHRCGPLLDALAAVIEDVASQRGISTEQVTEEIKSGSTIRDAPDFPEDSAECPFAEPEAAEETRENRARRALEVVDWQIPDPAEFAIWLRAVERYETGPVVGMSPGEQLFNCAVEADAIEGEWPKVTKHRAMFEKMAAELRAQERREPAELTTDEARALAQRWAAWRAYDENLAAFRRDDADYLPDEPDDARLDEYEREALLGWVRRRMLSAPASRSAMVAEVFEFLRWTADGYEAEHRSGYENGKALVWEICKAAGWPS